MTVATNDPNLPATPWGDLGDDVGLEDFNASDLSMPRLNVVGPEAVFQHRNTQEKFNRLTAVILGSVRQRIFWDKEVEEGDKPKCRSMDHNIGFPQMRTDIPKDKQFPWDQSNFDPASYPPGDDGLVRLPCAECIFKDWNSPVSKKPPCQEQWTLPLFYKDEDGILQPGLVSFKSASMKDTNAYLGAFKSARQPLFTVFTEITLRPQQRGQVKYATPIFSKGEQTDPSMWQQWADQYRGVRDMLRADPRPQEEETKGGKPVAKATAATNLAPDDPWATAQAASPAASPPSGFGDDDLPF